MNLFHILSGRGPDSEKMNKYGICRRLISILGLIGVLSMCVCVPEAKAEVIDDVAVSVKGFEVVILSSYKETMKIGQSRIIIAASTAGSKVTFKSSNSSVASVDMYGVVTAKKAGTCQITAKTSGAEARCVIQVEATKITLSTKTVSMENGATFQLSAKTSSGSSVSYKSSKQSVAIVSDAGLIQAIKPGQSIITVSSDGSKETCTVTVNEPRVSLSYNALKMYRSQTITINTTVSSGRKVTWSSSKPSVAVVDENGRVTAIKHGEARISAKVDGIVRYCTVTVMSPTITLSKSSVTLKKGKSYTLKAKVSSGQTPTYSTASKKVATVSKDGVITAKAKGNCTVSVTEDGTTVKCKVKVTE